MNNDSILLRRYAEEKSDAAFAELVNRHLDFVFSTAMREVRGDFARAQDVTQNVFTALARKASTLHRHATLVGWLHVSVHHAAAGLMRSEQRRQKREQEASAMLQQSSPSIAEDDWAQLKPVLNEVVQELGKVERDAILLRFYQKRPLGEIGATLRLSEAAVQKKVERALDRMRAGLVRRGITSTSVALGVMLQSHAVMAAPAGLLGTVTKSALASATAGGGAAAIFWGIGKIPFSLAAAAIVVGGATIAFQQRSDAGSEPVYPPAESAAPRSEGSKAVAAIAMLRSQPTGGQPQQQAASVTDLVSEPSAAEASSPFTSNQIRQWLAAANDPAVFARLTASGRALTLQRYSYLINQFQLTSAQTNEFLRLLDDKRQAPMDLAVASLQSGVDPRRDAAGFQSRLATEKSIIEKKIGTLLGSERYREYQAYNRQLNQETIFVRLNDFVGGSEHALNADQTARLQQLLETHPTTSPEMHTAAQTFLSPVQAAALHEILDTREIRKNEIPASVPSAEPNEQ